PILRPYDLPLLLLRLLPSSSLTVCIFFLTVFPRPTSTLFPYTTLFRSFTDLNMGILFDSLRADFGGLVVHKPQWPPPCPPKSARDRKSTRLNSRSPDHLVCRLLLEKKKNNLEILDPSNTNPRIHTLIHK